MLRPWAIVDKRGNVVFLTLADEESQLWTWWLGWPSEEEVTAKKAAGFVARPCYVKVQ